MDDALYDVAIMQKILAKSLPGPMRCGIDRAEFKKINALENILLGLSKKIGGLGDVLRDLTSRGKSLRQFLRGFFR
ncbi:MAG: hypothetical protein KUF72_04330 [Candidatus Thiodiazotropha sp. (ex Ctena orbiculata)]|nr:hypothetical protein [Candidatus Thiodiazotropha taylori]